MELYMCGFNGHHQLDQDQDRRNDVITQFSKVLRSPSINMRCALWSSTVIQSDGILLHQGYRPSRLNPTRIDGPPARNIKSIFGDTSGVLGALATDGTLYLYYDGSHRKGGPEFKKHRFPEDSFIVQQSLAIEYLAIADNGEVCICTNSMSRKGHSSEDTPSLSDSKPHFLTSPSTAKIQMFSSFQSLLFCEPATATHFIQTPLISLLASATSFTALTASKEVLTFGSALHPQSLGRDPTASHSANSPCAIPFLGGIPIAKVAVGGWVGAALSEDRDLYIWGGRAGEDRRMKALPRLSDDEAVRLVDINGGVDILEVGVGSGHVIALTAEGEVWAAGYGEFGQLGTGERRFEGDWVRVRGEWEGKGKVVGLGCGVWCSWVVVDNDYIRELTGRTLWKGDIKIHVWSPSSYTIQYLSLADQASTAVARLMLRKTKSLVGDLKDAFRNDKQPDVPAIPNDALRKVFSNETKPTSHTKSRQESGNVPASALRISRYGLVHELKFTLYRRSDQKFAFGDNFYRIPQCMQPPGTKELDPAIHRVEWVFKKEYASNSTPQKQESFKGVYSIWYKDSDPSPAPKPLSRFNGDFWLMKQLQNQPERGETIEWRHIPKDLLAELNKDWWFVSVLLPSIEEFSRNEAARTVATRAEANPAIEGNVNVDL